MMSISPSARQPLREAWPLERLIFERSLSLGFALHPNTTRAYSSHLNSYLTFCQLHHFPVDPTPDTLSFYVVFMAHHIQPRSIDNYLSGIVSQLEPHFPSVRAARNSDLVRRTMRGSLRRFSQPVRSRQSLSRVDLDHALSLFPRPFGHDDLCWLTMLLCAFFGLLRVGELVWPDSPDLQVHSQLTSRSSVLSDATSFSFTVPRRKSDDRFEGSRVCITASSLSPDPHALFLQYLGCRDAALAFSGHSLRAGGATSLAAAGVSPAQIQAIGHWSSSAWQRYVRKNPTLLQTLLFHGRPIHDPPFSSV